MILTIYWRSQKKRKGKQQTAMNIEDTQRLVREGLKCGGLYFVFDDERKRAADRVFCPIARLIRC